MSGSFLSAVGYKILNRTFSRQEICQFGSFNMVKEFLWFFILIPHFHIQLLGISLLIIYTFFSKEVEAPRSFFWVNWRVWVRIFDKPANYYNLGKQWPLTILFSVLHSLPMLHTLWESQELCFSDRFSR